MKLFYQKNHRGVLNIFYSVYIIFAWANINTCKAQVTHYHQTAWGRISILDTINKKLEWHISIQYRTQNDHIDKQNIFKREQFQSYALWLRYKYSRDWEFTISPFGYFYISPLIASEADAKRPPIKEYRFSIRAEQINTYRHFKLFNRYSLEYRLRDINNDRNYIPGYRVRYMLRFEKNLTKLGLKKRNLGLEINDEVMLQFGEAVKNNVNRFDQNRIYAGFSLGLTDNIKLRLGYLYIIQQRGNGKEFDKSDNIWAILSFENIFSQFKRKPLPSN